MNSYYTQIIWYVDEIFLSLIFFLVLVALSRETFGKLWHKRQQRKLNLIIADMQKLFLSQDVNRVEGCINILQNTSQEQFFNIIKLKDYIWPRKYESELFACIRDSGKLEELKKIASGHVNKWTRVEAIIASGYLNDPDFVDILKKTIFSKDDTVAYFSMLSLGRIKDERSIHVLIDAIRHRRFSGYKIASILEKFPRELTRTIIKYAGDDDPDVRFWIVKVVARLKAYEYVKKICELTYDAVPDIRAAACECLGKITMDKNCAELKAHIRDEVWYVRLHSMRALKNILREGCLPYIIDLVYDTNWYVKEAFKSIMLKYADKSLAYMETVFQGDDVKAKKDCVEILDESGYIQQVFMDVFSADDVIRNKAMRFIRYMLSSGEHIGLENMLLKVDAETAKTMLEAIAFIDKDMADHIQKKLNNMIVEF